MDLHIKQQLSAILGAFIGILTALILVAVVLTIKLDTGSYKYWLVHVALAIVIATVTTVSVFHRDPDSSFVDSKNGAHDQIENGPNSSEQPNFEVQEPVIADDLQPLPSSNMVSHTIQPLLPAPESSQLKHDSTPGLTSLLDSPTSFPEIPSMPQNLSKQEEQLKTSKKAKKKKTPKGKKQV